jgi:hypothetical protein
MAVVLTIGVESLVSLMHAARADLEEKRSSSRVAVPPNASAASAGQPAAEAPSPVQKCPHLRAEPPGVARLALPDDER